MKFTNIKYAPIFAILIITLLMTVENTKTEAKTSTLSTTSAKSQTSSTTNSQAHTNMAMMSQAWANMKTLMKTKRSESMMEYLNSFFGEEPKRKHGSYYAKNEGYRFSQKSHMRKFDNVTAAPAAEAGAAGAATNSTAKGTNSSGPQPVLGEGAPVMAEWFEISSPSFKSKDKFPTCMLPDGSERNIIYDQGYYRVNNAYSAAQGDSKPPGPRHFYFRLSGLNLYYTSTKTDINVLGAIAITAISNVSPNQDPTTQNYCLAIEDDDHHKWRICNASEDVIKQWKCAIRKLLAIEDPECQPINEQFNATIVSRNITQPIVIIPLPSRQCNEDWDYQENGQNWECECSEGREQSPIDLPPIAEAIDSPVKPLFQYDEVKGEEGKGSGKKSKSLKIKLDENMIKIVYDKFGKLVTMDGAVFYATEIQIHTPGEHTINGKKFDMEVQIIHAGVSKGDLAKQAILSFPIEKRPGIYNKFIDDLDFFNLPNALSPEREIVDALFIPKILYTADDEGAGSMKPFSFYTYQGSLTSPPCSEQTIIYVASKPIPLGSTAIHLFQEALRQPDQVGPYGQIQSSSSALMSNRKIQDLNGRPVFHYNHEKYCGPEPVKVEPKKPGHYERIEKPITDYFFVDGDNPSGLPGALVVSKKEATGTSSDQ